MRRQFAKAVTSAWLAVAIACAPSFSRAEDAIAVIERAKRSVVAVGTFERTRMPQFSFRGTGFAVDDGTLVVTNAHVVPELADGGRIEQLGILIPQPGAASGVFREARVVATDAATDLALLKVGGTPLPPMRIGDSERAKEGQSILLSGFPIGAALGPFAATHRGMLAAIAPIAIPQARSKDLDPKVVRRLAQGSFNIFQLDATAYPGNSGSPVYDASSGDVLGVVNMVLIKSTKENVLAQPSGITYAIPSKYILELLQKAR
ncbi:MAG: trypsin-like peptidase domain-containing protein [Burkholderiales bacterium]|nr:trypsin-like peptidase domain-containing protein [Burkholderiales bacterium]